MLFRSSMKKKIKHLKLSTEKKKANVAFSKFIRMSNASHSGFLLCYSCPVGSQWNDGMDAGHGITGRNNAVLFMEEVVRPQCKQCNIFKKGNLAVFTRKLIGELGIKKYDKLVLLAHQTVKFTALDYKDIAEKYIEKLKELGE